MLRLKESAVAMMLRAFLSSYLLQVQFAPKGFLWKEALLRLFLVGGRLPRLWAEQPGYRKLNCVSQSGVLYRNGVGSYQADRCPSLCRIYHAVGGR